MKLFWLLVVGAVHAQENGGTWNIQLGQGGLPVGVVTGQTSDGLRFYVDMLEATQFPIQVWQKC